MPESPKAELLIEYYVGADAMYRGVVHVRPELPKTLRPMVQVMMGRLDWVGYVAMAIRTHPEAVRVCFRKSDLVDNTTTDYELPEDALEKARLGQIDLEPFIR